MATGRDDMSSSGAGHAHELYPSLCTSTRTAAHTDADTPSADEYIYGCIPTKHKYVLACCLHLCLCPQQRCDPQCESDARLAHVYAHGCCQLAPSGTGVQASLCGCGVFGFTCARSEGLRCQLCMLEFGAHPARGHLFWPGVGVIRLAACCMCRCCRSRVEKDEEACIDPIAPWPLTAEERREAEEGHQSWNT